jgi:hypothetical protein
MGRIAAQPRAKPSAPPLAPLVTSSLRELVAAASRVGRQRAAFLADWRERHLSQEAWIEASVALSGLDAVALVELRARIEVECPRVRRLCLKVADGWGRSYARDGLPPTDRPGPHDAFDDDQREPGAWLERKMAGISVEAASGIAGLLAAEQSLRGWGRCERVGEAEERLQGWAQELAALQTRIAAAPPSWGDLEPGAGDAVLVAGVPLLPWQSLAQRAADAGALVPGTPGGRSGLLRAA